MNAMFRSAEGKLAVVAVLLGVLVRSEQLSAANLSGAGVILVAAALGITSSRARSPKH